MAQGSGTAVKTAAEQLGAAVVGIGRGSRGTGFVVAPGKVLTNAHNLRDRTVSVHFGDGRSVQGAVAGVDADGDLAVIDVDTADTGSVPWGDGAAIGIGDDVVALSAAGGTLHATAGSVAAVDSKFRSPQGWPVSGAVEHTAPLPRGSSGGPLVADGAVVGINTNRVGGGLYQARPVTAQLRDRVDALARGETPARPRLGVALAHPRQARHAREAVGLEPREGLLVTGVDAEGPAAAAGISRGDLLTAAGDRALRHPDDLFTALESAGAGATLTVTILRGTDERTVEVTLAAASSRSTDESAE